MTPAEVTGLRGPGDDSRYDMADVILVAIACAIDPDASSDVVADRVRICLDVLKPKAPAP